MTDQTKEPLSDRVYDIVRKIYQTLPDRRTHAVQEETDQLSTEIKSLEATNAQLREGLDEAIRSIEDSNWFGPYHTEEMLAHTKSDLLARLRKLTEEWIDDTPLEQWTQEERDDLSRKLTGGDDD